MSEGEKKWPAAQLRRRGWTDALIKELLPAPLYVREGRWTARAWLKADVLAAERDPRFLSRRVEAPRAAQPGVRHAARLLQEAWEGAERDGSAPWVLAGHYHGALMDRLLSIARGPELPAAQATAWLSEFLALERRSDSTRLLGVLKNFLRAGAFLGSCADHARSREVLERYPYVLRSFSEQAIADFSAVQPEAKVPDMLSMEGFPRTQLFKEGLGAVWSVWYVPQAIRTSLSLLIALNPKDEYPEARAMRRHFVIHLGGTNTGKTYAGFQRLRRAPTGVYLAPLRLLALEAQETLLKAGVECGLTTGEEEDLREEDTHVAATAEKLDLRAHYDVAVIDECRPSAGLRLDAGYPGGPCGGGPPLRRAGGPGYPHPPHRELRGQL